MSTKKSKTESHTPGPWHLSGGEGRPPLTICANKVGLGMVGIADVYYGDFPEVDTANARLMSAAPELLESLKDCLFLLEKVRSNPSCILDGEVIIMVAESEARSAIRKATGTTT